MYMYIYIYICMYIYVCIYVCMLSIYIYPQRLAASGNKNPLTQKVAWFPEIKCNVDHLWHLFKKKLNLKNNLNVMSTIYGTSLLLVLLSLLIILLILLLRNVISTSSGTSCCACIPANASSSSASSPCPENGTPKACSKRVRAWDLHSKNQHP